MSRSGDFLQPIAVSGREVLTEFEQIDFGEKDLGIFFLESIVDGLYKNRLNIVREYAQNETDTGVADEIRVDVKGKNLLISGNGPGMDYDEVLDAKRIGFPTKNPLTGPEAGFRHIGLWSGVSACETVFITAKKRSSSYSTMLKIDAAGLRDDFVKRSQKYLTQALREHVAIKRVDVPLKDQIKHGTVVQLHNVRDDHPELLDGAKLKAYLQNTAPVDFDPKEFEHYDLMKGFLETNVPNYRTYKILLNGKQIFRPPIAAPRQLHPPDTFTTPIIGTKKLRAYAWVCHNKRPGELEDENGWGLVYKWKGWTVGDQHTIQKLLLTEPSKVKWMVGEVHVLDIEGIRPNTEKDDFEPSGATQELEGWLRGPVWDQLRQRVHVTSSTNKAIERAQEAEQLTEKLPKFDQEEAWNNHVYELEDLARKLEHDYTNSKVQGGVKPRIDRAVKRIRAQLKKVRKAHDEWRRSLPSAGKKEPSTEKQKAKQKEESREKEETDDQTVDTFEAVKPEMDRVASKANLNPDAVRILETCLRVLSRQLKMPLVEVRDFLDLLELELGAGGTK